MGVGVFAYMIAVAQRTSFGVASTQAADRFGAAASELSLFTMLQVLIYAGMQIPVGVLVDRLGSRRMVAIGAGLMIVGQLILAVARSATWASCCRSCRSACCSRRPDGSRRSCRWQDCPC